MTVVSQPQLRQSPVGPLAPAKSADAADVPRTGAGREHGSGPGHLTQVITDWRLMAWRYLMRFLRDPANVAGSVVQPVMFVLMFRYVLGGAIEVQGSYADFLIPGALAMATAFGSAATAIGLAEDLNAGMIDRFRSMPVARSAVLAGRLLFDLMKYTMLVLLMLAIGFLSGFRFDNGFFPAVAMLLMALLFGVAASCVSAYLGMKIRKPEAVLAFGFLWMFPVTFISSAFVPVVFMPGWLQAVAKANPVSIIIEAMRAMALGGPIAVRAIEAIAWIIGIMVVAAPLAVNAYRKAA